MRGETVMLGRLLRVLRSWVPWFKEPEAIVQEEVKRDKVAKEAEPEEERPSHSFDSANWKLKDLRKQIDQVMASLSYRDYKASKYSHGVPKKVIKALRNIGPYICSPSTMIALDKTEFISVHHFPALAFIGFPKEKEVRLGDDTPMRFLYAIKADKRTLLNLERAPGCHVYECGQGAIVNKKFMNNETEDAKLDVRSDKNDRLVWIRTFVAVDKVTGVPRPLKEMHNKTDVIVTKRHRHHGYTPPSVSVHNKVWEYPYPKEDMDRSLAALSVCLNTWVTREWHWNVVCKSLKNKVTFSVPQNDAKRFFKDREIEIGGRRKPIFHMVKAHYRTYKTGKETTVKGHHRGNRHFQWDDYEISIIAPGLNAPSLVDTPFEAHYTDKRGPQEGLIEIDEATKVMASAYNR